MSVIPTGADRQRRSPSAQWRDLLPIPTKLPSRRPANGTPADPITHPIPTLNYLSSRHFLTLSSRPLMSVIPTGADGRRRSPSAQWRDLLPTRTKFISRRSGHGTHVEGPAVHPCHPPYLPPLSPTSVPFQEGT